MTRLTAAIAAMALAGAAQAAPVVVFKTGLTSVPPQLDAGVAVLTGVEGYAGLGHGRNAFKGSFLRSPGNNRVTLTLTDLPPHRFISLCFLFAAIDSLDGSGAFPSDDNFEVTLDGTTLFRETFANATPDQVQSYVPPPGVELARGVPLGFSAGSFYNDSAYDMGRDPTFHKIAHTGTTAVFTFTLLGAGVQDLADESWAFDNLLVKVHR